MICFFQFPKPFTFQETIFIEIILIPRSPPWVSAIKLASPFLIVGFVLVLFLLLYTSVLGVLASSFSSDEFNFISTILATSSSVGTFPSLVSSVFCRCESPLALT